MAKDYYYLVGFSTHEGADSIWLSSKKKYTQKQFNKMCVSVTPEATKDYLLCIQGTQDKALAGQGLLDIRFESFYSYIADHVAKRYGFKVIAPHRSFCLFGLANILDTEDWKAQRCESMEAMREKMEKAGFGRGFCYCDLWYKDSLKKPRSKS